MSRLLIQQAGFSKHALSGLPPPQAAAGIQLQAYSACQPGKPPAHLGLGGGRGLGGLGRGGGGRGLGGFGRGGGRGCTGMKGGPHFNASGRGCTAGAPAAALAGAADTAWLLCNQQACTSRLWPSMHCRVTDEQLHVRAGSSEGAQARRRRGRYSRIGGKGQMCGVGPGSGPTCPPDAPHATMPPTRHPHTNSPQNQQHPPPLPQVRRGSCARANRFKRPFQASTAPT